MAWPVENWGDLWIIAAKNRSLPMCSGCSGDYYSDFTGLERLSEDSCGEGIEGGVADKNDPTVFHYGNRAGKSVRGADAWVGRNRPHDHFGSGTREECEIF